MGHQIGIDNITLPGVLCLMGWWQTVNESRRKGANPAFERMEDTSKTLCLILSFMNLLLDMCVLCL